MPTFFLLFCYYYFVVIRTNSASTTLTVNAASGIVHHYGSAGSVNIIKIASNSYHENGTVAFLEVANGRVALESKSEVTQIHLNATEGNFNDITIAKSAEVEMPAFSRDPVEIPSEGKLVVALQEGTTNADADKDYVWLTAIGIYEQVTVSDSKTSAGTEYAATSTSVNAEKKETAQQIANNITFTSDSVDYKVTATTADNGVTWTYEVKTEAGETAAEYSAESSGSTVTVTNVSTSAAVETTKENGLTEAKKNEVKEEVVEVAKNVEELQKAEESGYEITHHDALAPTCTEEGHTAYDSYFVNNEEVKVGYKEIAALDHDVNSDTGVCNRCNAQIYVYKVGNALYKSNQFSAAWSAAKNSSNSFKILCDLALNVIQADGRFTLDLNGKTLTLRGHASLSGAVRVYGLTDYGGDLTIQNGTLELPGTNNINYGIYSEGNLTVENVTINSACKTTVYVDGLAWNTVGSAYLENVTINSTHSSGTAFNSHSVSMYGTLYSPASYLKNCTITSTYNAVSINATNATLENCSLTSGENCAWIIFSATGGSATGTMTIKGETSFVAGSDYRRLHAQDGNSIVVEAGTYNFDPTSYVDTNSYTITDHGNSTWTVSLTE